MEDPPADPRIDVPHFLGEAGADLVETDHDAAILRFLVEKR